MYLATQKNCMLVIGKEASTLGTLYGIANCVKSGTKKFVSSNQYQHLARRSVANTYFRWGLRIFFILFLQCSHFFITIMKCKQELKGRSIKFQVFSYDSSENVTIKVEWEYNNFSTPWSIWNKIHKFLYYVIFWEIILRTGFTNKDIFNSFSEMVKVC